MKQRKANIFIAIISTCFILLPTGVLAQFSQADLVGTWYDNTLYSGARGTWERAVITIDETGNFTSTITGENGETLTVSGIVSISEQGIITKNSGDAPAFEGVMNPEKNIITFTDTYEAEAYALSVLIKSGSGLVQEDLIGNWYQHTLYNNSMAYWDRGPFIINEMGDVTGEIIFPDGQQIPLEIPGFLNMIYLADDGQITSDSVLGGALNSSKNIMVLTASYEDGTNGLSIFMKNDAVYAQSDLAGTWYMQALYAGEIAFWVKAILRFDENGNFTAAGVNALGDQMSGSGSGTISEDGIITLTDAPTYQGTLSNDKNMIVLTGDESQTVFNLAVLTRLSEEVGPGAGTGPDPGNECDSKHAECVFNCGSGIDCLYECAFRNEECLRTGVWPSGPMPGPNQDSADNCAKCEEYKVKCAQCEAEYGDDPFVCDDVCGAKEASCNLCTMSGGGIR